MCVLIHGRWWTKRLKSGGSSGGEFDVLTAALGAVLCYAIHYSTILVMFSTILLGVAERRSLRGDSKEEVGNPVSVDRGKPRVMKQTLISSATSTAGFRQSSQHTLGTTRAATLPLSSSPPREESDSSCEEGTLHDADTKTLAMSTTNPSRTEETHISRDAKLTGRKTRYIAFIGNLPFNATSDDIVESFQKKGLKLSEVRLLTKKGSGESRGCCFVEFPNAKSLQASELTAFGIYI